MFRPTPLLAFLIFTFALLTNSLSAEEKRFVKPVNQWAGVIEDVSPGLGETKIITDSKTLTKWWMDFVANGKIPEVDFSKDIVVIVFSRGASLDIKASIEDGALSVFGYGTTDTQPGMRYVVGAFSRAGVKKINDKELK